MDKEMTNRCIPWSNCLSLGCDNASVMTGWKKGVFAFMKEKQPEIFLSGCTLHLIHIAAKKAAEVLPPVEEILVGVFFYFDKSEKRKSQFKGTQSLFDVEQKRMLKHGQTRWLSIGRCLERLLFNWIPLKAFFKEQYDQQESKRSKRTSSPKSLAANKASPAVTVSKPKSKSSPEVSKQESGKTPLVNSKSVKSPAELSYAEKKVESIFSFLRSPTNRLYVLFLNYTVHVYDDVLVNLQTEDPKIHILRRSLQKVIRNVMSRFLKPAAVVGKPLDEVHYKLKYNQRANSEIVIGEAAQAFIKEKEANHLKDSRIEEFYQNAHSYFVKACEYMLEKLPWNSPLLHHAEVADVSLQLSSNSKDLIFFLQTYPCLVPEGVTQDTIIEEFTLYQTEDITACVQERLDATWQEIGKSLKVNNLARVMCGILTIPHSSAHCERIFSTVRKNRTDQRSSLGDATLETLLVLKAKPGTPADECRQHSSKTLKRLKSSCYAQVKKLKV